MLDTCNIIDVKRFTCQPVAFNNAFKFILIKNDYGSLMSQLLMQIIYKTALLETRNNRGMNVMISWSRLIAVDSKYFHPK